MAGGIGSRFWSMSTPAYPKQFIGVSRPFPHTINSRQIETNLSCRKHVGRDKKQAMAISQQRRQGHPLV